LLRKCLDNFLCLDIKKLDYSIIQSSSNFRKFSYRIMRCNDFSKSNNTYLFLHPKFNKPYVLLIDEFVVYFSFHNENYDNFNQKDYFSINKQTVESCLLNECNSNEKILTISFEVFEKVIKGLIEYTVDIRKENYSLIFNEIYLKLGLGVEMKLSKLGRNFTIEQLEKSTFNVLKSN